MTLHGQETTIGVTPLQLRTAASKTSAIRTNTSAGEVVVSKVSVKVLQEQYVTTVAVMGGIVTQQGIAQAHELADSVRGLVAEKAT